MSERGVCSCAELQVFSCYRGWKEACQATNAISTTWRCKLSSSFFFFLQGKALKEIHAILTETLGEHAPLYVTIKNWVAQFKHGDFSTCDVPRSGRPKTVTTPEITDQIHKLILEDRRISAKWIAEQLGISRERVGSIIHEVLGMRKLSAKWVSKCLNADEKHQRCQSSAQLVEFFDAIQMIFCRDWWPWMKPMTRRQSNNQWSGSIAAHPAQKNSECKNPLDKFSPRFFGIKTASSSLIIFQRAKLSPRSVIHLYWCNWRTFWSKRASGGKVTKRFLFLHDNAPGPRALTTRKKLTYLGFQYPEHQPILRIWPRRTTTCSLD